MSKELGQNQTILKTTILRQTQSKFFLAFGSQNKLFLLQNKSDFKLKFYYKIYPHLHNKISIFFHWGRSKAVFGVWVTK